MKNTKWIKWCNRKKIAGKNQPAVYFIAYSENDISDSEFTMLKEIVYIGVTFSTKGLNGRLNQFKSAMTGKKKVHGGAERVLFANKDIEAFFNNAFVSARIFDISTVNSEIESLRIKGKCLGNEYESFAEYFELHNELPKFNNRNSPKHK